MVEKEETKSDSKLIFFDIGANLMGTVDPYTPFWISIDHKYFDKKTQEPDVDDVIARAKAAGVKKLLITGELDRLYLRRYLLCFS